MCSCSLSPPSSSKIIKWGIREPDRYQHFYKSKPNINMVLTCLADPFPNDNSRFHTLRKTPTDKKILGPKKSQVLWGPEANSRKIMLFMHNRAKTKAEESLWKGKASPDDTLTLGVPCHRQCMATLAPSCVCARYTTASRTASIISWGTNAIRTLVYSFFLPFKNVSTGEQLCTENERAE